MPKQIISDDMARQIDENILKTIKQIQLRKGEAYVSDLASELDMAPANAYSTISRLVEKGHLLPLNERHDGSSRKKRAITFTVTGENIANTLLERHQLLQEWLIRLGSTQEDADRAACSIEHSISDHALKIIGRHVDMALQFREMGDSAPEIMRKMAEVMNATDKEAEKVLLNEMRRTVEQAGGIEGIARKEAIIAEAGGEKELTALLERVRELGGLRAIEAEIADKKNLIKRAGGQDKFDYAIRFAERFRDLGEMEQYILDSENSQAFIKKAGSMEQAKELLATRKYLEAHGGLETFKQLLRTADRYGGVEEMTKLLSTERKVWARVFDAVAERKKE